MTRRLQLCRRHVPLDHADDYLLAWDDARRAVEAAGGHAWIFRGADHEDRFMEFIEWREDFPSPMDDESVVIALDQLDTFAVPTQPDEWEEVSDFRRRAADSP